MSNQAVNLKAVVELQQAIDYLEDLTESLKSGTVCISQGSEEQVVLKPASLIELEMTVQQKGLKEALRFELSWRKQAPTVNEPLSLRISSQVKNADD